ncbi:MAG: cellulase family glycosylhydrolase [Bacteroidetes bacterium]|nr:cellulase family glycosylhydrolase [Bacteroidota bacterium]
MNKSINRLLPYRSNFCSKKMGVVKNTITNFLCSMLVCIAASYAQTGMRNLTTLQVTADMEAGWNLGNAMDAHPGSETSWGNPLATQAMIDQIKQKGFKTIRIPITWYSHLGPAPDYTIDTAWLDRVEEVVNYALTNEMYVILNLHHEESWCKPTYALQDTVTAELVAIWTQIANRFIYYSDYLIFETLNEPRLAGSPQEYTGGTAEGRDVVNKLNLAAVNTVRSSGGNNAIRFIMCPPYSAAGWGTPLNEFVVPNNDSLVIVSIHNYAPIAFCLQSPGVSTWGSAADKAQADNDMALYYNKFVNQGRGVVIGEWGALVKDNTSDRTAYSDYFVRAAKSRKITTVVWDNGNLGISDGMGFFNRNSLTWGFPTIADAIVNNFITDVSNNETLPNHFMLQQNYPNPFNPSTTISYSLTQKSIVSLKVYDLIGREVANLLQNEKKSAGNYEVTFSGSKLSSGVYYYKLSVTLEEQQNLDATPHGNRQANIYTETKKLVLVK